MSRNKQSIGACHFHQGTERVFDETFVLDNSRTYYAFDIVPTAKPRMTQRDRWKKRDIIVQWYAFKDLLKLEAKQMNYEVGSILEAVFFIPMPSSWSNKKKEQMNGTKHEQRPDIDNLIKGFLDALMNGDSDDDNDDKKVWKDNSEKRWAYNGSILIYK